MERPLAEKRPIGPFMGSGGINELQFNFRFNLAGGDDIESMKPLVAMNSPPTADVRDIIVAPDVRNEVISVTTDNQMVYSDLEAWRGKVVEALENMDSTSGLEEVVIIGL